MDYIKANNTYFATPKDYWKDRIEVEVGDSKQPDFKPQVKIMRWDNEVNFSARLKDFDNFTVSKDGEKIKAVNDKKEVHLYDIAPCVEHSEGGHEFEVILKEKPTTNVIEFSLNTKGLDFFYQPFLKNENSDGSFWEIDKTGIRIECPANVAGSYAVYVSENKVNYVGGKEYKCGKVGHIFRPKIIDSVGIEVWGELKIDKDILSVTIPQNFLDNAVYPIKHAAGLEFGYHTNGGLGASFTGNNLVGYKGTTGASAGTVDSISMYGYAGSGTVNVKAVITDSSLAILTNGVGGVVAITTTIGWFDMAYSSKPSVSASTAYYLCVVFNGNSTIRFDTSGSGVQLDDTSNSYNTPTDPTDGTTSGTKKYSIYCTYTAGGGATAVKPLRTLLGIGT